MYLSPPSSLLQRDCVEPISFLASRIPLLDRSINQLKIGSFLTTSQKSKQQTHNDDDGENLVWYNASQEFDNGEEES